MSREAARRAAVLLCLLVPPTLASTRPMDAAPLEQDGAALACAWEKLAPQTPLIYYMATTYDGAGRKAYSYGGINQAGQAVDNVSVLDLSNADLSKARFVNASTVGSRSLSYGAAAAFRPAGDKSAAYFIGGADPNGDGKNQVQVLTLKTNTWRSTVPSGSVDRIFSAAVYVPGHDVIVVQGGTKRCPLDGGSPAQGDCQGENLGTSYLKIDDATGELRFLPGPKGGPQNLVGSTLVFEPLSRQVLAYGGSPDNNLAEARVFSLDLSDPDLSKATWKALAVEGARPQGRYLHAAAYDTTRRMMVVQGGIRVAGMSDSENVLTDTWALDLSSVKARWVNLSATLKDLVGGAMIYPAHHAKPMQLGGRTQYKSRSAPVQTANRELSALGCRTAPTPTPEPTRVPIDVGAPKICSGLLGKVPTAIITNAMANPQDIGGFGEPANPALPPGPINPPKTYLGLQNTGVPFHPLFNSVIFKSACP
ncbi:MAG: kelch repeat-containing protein [Anaerolineae bacterium]